MASKAGNLYSTMSASRNSVSRMVESFLASAPAKMLTEILGDDFHHVAHRTFVSTVDLHQISNLHRSTQRIMPQIHACQLSVAQYAIVSVSRAAADTTAQLTAQSANRRQKQASSKQEYAKLCIHRSPCVKASEARSFRCCAKVLKEQFEFNDSKK